MSTFQPTGLFKTQTVNIPAASTITILPENKFRKYLFLQNNSVIDVNLILVNSDGTEVPRILKGNLGELEPKSIPVNEIKIENPDGVTAVDILIQTLGD